MRHWRLYRNLALIYAVAMVFFVAEYRRRMQENMQEDDIYLKPDSKYTEVISQVYPQRNEPEFYTGFRTIAGYQPDLSPQRIREDPQRAEAAFKKRQEESAAAVAHYRKSIEGGMVSQEMLFYQYALALMRMRAEPATIDKAIADWRRNYPFSRQVPLEQIREHINADYEVTLERIRQAKEEQRLEELRRAREKLYPGRQRKLETP